MIGTHDRVETEADIQKAIVLLQIAKQEFDALNAPDPPLPGSMLYEEGRRHTAYEPLDTVVIQHRARAADNLERAFDLMFDLPNAQVLAYPYALYSLIRTAIESAAVALWVIDSERKAPRVLRSLQLTYRDTVERRQFFELIAPDDYVAAELVRQSKILDRLAELKDTVGTLRQKPLTGPPKYTEILKSVSAHTGRSGPSRYELTSPLVIWKMCSAFIHGSHQLVQALSDFRQVTEFRDGIASVEVTPSLQTLAAALHAAVTLLSRADRRFVHLATHDYGGRLVS
jgi:hypothetical protein